MSVTTSELAIEIAQFACEKARDATQRVLGMLEAGCTSLQAKRKQAAAGKPLRSTGKAAAEAASKAAGSIREALSSGKAGEAISRTVGSIRKAAPSEEAGEAVSEATGAVEDVVSSVVPGAGKREASEGAAEKEQAQAGGAGEEPEKEHAEARGEKGDKESEEEHAEARGEEGDEASEEERAEARSEEGDEEQAETRGEEGEEASEEEHAQARSEEGDEEQAEARGEGGASEKERGAEAEAGGNGKASDEKPKGYLGVTPHRVRLANGKSEEEPSYGLMLLSVEPEGPAAEAGLMQGDTLLEMDGEPLHEPSDLAAQLAAHKAGERLRTEVLRAGEHQTLTVEIGAPP